MKRKRTEIGRPEAVKIGKGYGYDGAGQVKVDNSHLQGGGKGDSRGAEATRSSDLGLMEVVVGGIGRGRGGGCGWQGRCSP